MNEVFCRGEGRNYPEEEFESLPAWGLCHTRNVTHRHTIGGSSIDAPPPVVEEADVSSNIDVLPGEEKPGW
jgi:hypothetical protein